MDKEAQEKIAKIELKPFHLYDWFQAKNTLQAHTHLKPRGIDLILQAIEELGYRKLPDRPELEKTVDKVLTDICNGVWHSARCGELITNSERAEYRKQVLALIELPKDKLYKQFPLKKKYRIVSPTSEPYKPN